MQLIPERGVASSPRSICGMTEFESESESESEAVAVAVAESESDAVTASLPEPASPS
jgi:hypothetical protein